MLRTTCLPILLLGAIWAIPADKPVCAQDKERAEGLFKYTDRDGNGEIDTEEYRRLSDGTRERLQKLGIDGKRNVKKDEFIAGVVGVEELRRKEQAERDGGSSSSSSRSSPGRGSLIAGGRGNARLRITADLPTQYAAMDKNGDGQVGLAEWDRAKLADFRNLDRNSDGFLSPRELVNAPTTSNTANAAAKTAGVTPGSPTPGAPPPGGVKVATPAVAKPAPAPASGSTAPPAEPEDPVLRQAKFYFTSVDKDKDGQITPEEWQTSRGARPMFEKANVTPTLPMSQDAFVEQFKQIKQTQK